ncbi:MAG TPA: PilZ domain-containing protein [Planctomycetota bacterium]|nr:PilZ domain-containing protein [Planctomycetota bacterium]
MSDLREFTRINRNLELVIDLPGRVLAGRTRDVSLRGALVSCSEVLSLGTTCTCTLILDGGDGQVRIRAAGRVMRHVADGLAMRFDELLDPESYEHLCQLIRYNALDPEKAEREIAAHIGLKKPAP